MPLGHWRSRFCVFRILDVTFKSTWYYRLKAQAFLLLTFTSKLVTVFGQIVPNDILHMIYPDTFGKSQAVLSVTVVKSHCHSKWKFVQSRYLSSFKSINCHTDVKVTLFEPKSIFGGAKQAQFSSCQGYMKSNTNYLSTINFRIKKALSSIKKIPS